MPPNRNRTARRLGRPHAATERFNELAEEFEENDSEIETVARDTIATDMEYIAQSYGFEDADIEELVAPRDW